MKVSRAPSWAISESQERMAVVVAEKDVDAFIALAAQENLAATPRRSRHVTTASMKMLFKGRTIVDISRDFLDTNGVKQVIAAEICDDVPQYFCPRAAQDFREGPRARPCPTLNVLPPRRGFRRCSTRTIGARTVFNAFRRQDDQLTPANRHGCQDLRRRNGRRDRLRLRLLF